MLLMCFTGFYVLYRGCRVHPLFFWFRMTFIVVSCYIACRFSVSRLLEREGVTMAQTQVAAQGLIAVVA